MENENYKSPTSEATSQVKIKRNLFSRISFWVVWYFVVDLSCLQASQRGRS